MQELIQNLNKNGYINSIRKKLAEIAYESIINNNENIKQNEEILSNELEKIIGNMPNCFQKIIRKKKKRKKELCLTKIVNSLKMIKYLK